MDVGTAGFWARRGNRSVGAVLTAALLTAAVAGGCSSKDEPIAAPTGDATDRAVAGTPDTTLLDVERGLVVVGADVVGTRGTSQQGQGHARLWVTADGLTWRDITPPSALHPGFGRGAVFQSASFVDASTGWVTMWNPDNTDGVVMATADGGRRWRVVLRTGHNASAGSTTLVQLVTPKVAAVTTVEPNGPTMDLEITRDGGRTWTAAYQGPDGAGGPGQPGPYETAFLFRSASEGFAANGIPPVGVVAGPGPAPLFETGDGARHWTRLSPPVPTAAAACKPTEGTPFCVFDLPRLTPDGEGTLVSEVVSGKEATLGFDLTSDAGRHWRLVSALRVPLPDEQRLQGGEPQQLALESTTPAAWWVLASTKGGAVATRVSTNHGAHWTTHESGSFTGTPLSLQAVDATHAWLTAVRGDVTVLYRTSDAGDSWQPVVPR